MVTRPTSPVSKEVPPGALGPYVLNSDPGHASASALRSSERVDQNVLSVRDDPSTATAATSCSSLTTTSSWSGKIKCRPLRYAAVHLERSLVDEEH